MVVTQPYYEINSPKFLNQFPNIFFKKLTIMKTLFEKISILFLLTAILVACKGIHEQSLPIDEETIKTRASDFEATDYYWCNGEKIPLQQIENKFYVLFSADNKNLIGEIVSASIEFTRFEDVSEFNSYLHDM